MMLFKTELSLIPGITADNGRDLSRILFTLVNIDTGITLVFDDLPDRVFIELLTVAC